MRMASILPITSLMLAGSGGASDLRFGADGLPYLTRNATLIIEVAEAEPREVTKVAAVYEVKVADVLKGEIARGTSLLIAALIAADVPRPDLRPGAVVFLRPPTSPALKDLRPQPGGSVMEVVSGGVGAVPPAGAASRKGLVREYVAMGDATRLEWAAKNLTSPDTYVQRSAMLELAEPKRSREDQAVVQALAESLASPAVRWENKGVAVNLLAQSRSPVALHALDALARDSRTPRPLRLDAVQAISALPNSREKLNEYRRSQDPVLAPAAKELLDRRGAGEIVRPPSGRSFAEVQKQIGSSNVKERREAAAAASELAFSTEVLNLLREAAGPRETSDAVQLAAVDSLARFGNRESAGALQEIALNSRLPRTVRSSAILSIAKLETGVGLPALRRLAASLTDPEMKRLATGLAEQ